MTITGRQFGRRLIPRGMAALVAILGLALIVACSPGNEQTPASSTGVPQDAAPEIEVFDFAARVGRARIRPEPHQVYIADRSRHRQLKEGWAMPETLGRTGEAFVWAVDHRATVELELSRTDDRSFFFRCWPFRYQDAPAQTIAVRVNGSPIGSVELGNKTETYSLALDPGVLVPGTNRIELTFAYAAAPRDHSSTSEDPRTLAAAFTGLGFGGEPSLASLPQVTDLQRVGEDALHLAVPGGAVVDYSVFIPAGGRLATGFRLEGSATTLTGEVWVFQEGREPELAFSTDDSPTNQRHSVNLAGYAGTVVGLGFLSRGHGHVIWEAPRLVGVDSGLDAASNVILIDIDTLRADVLSCYGGEAETPNIDALARSGVLFDRAYSHIPITGPSHSTIFTSTLPAEHGVHNNGHILSDDEVTLAEILRGGYRHTAAFVSLGVLMDEFGTAQGFDHYSDTFDLDWFKDATEINEEVLPWLEAHHEESFFLWVHYSDPHEPYAPQGRSYPGIEIFRDEQPLARVEAAGRTISLPVRLPPGTSRIRFEAAPPFFDRHVRFSNWRVSQEGCTVAAGEGMLRRVHFGVERFYSPLPATLDITCSGDEVREAQFQILLMERLKPEDCPVRYVQEVEQVDRAVGELMAAVSRLGLTERSLVILTADHGESLGDHNFTGHVDQLYDPCLRVPLILRFPERLPPGQRVAAPVGHLDLAPTILDFLGFPAAPGHRGQSLMPLIGGGEIDSRPVVAETYKPESKYDRRALVSGGHKFITTDGFEVGELFYYPDDPLEENNLYLQNPELSATLRDRLARDLAAVRKQGPARSAVLSEEELKQLEALGYVH